MKNIFTPPYRVGKKMGRAIVDSKGLLVVVFDVGREGIALDFCDFLNRRYITMQTPTKTQPMKDFLNYLLTVPQRIGKWIAHQMFMRRVRIEHRRAEEHARKVELAQKGIELIEATFVGMAALLAKKAELEVAKRTKFPPGGIATPGTEHAKGGVQGPEVDTREWFVSDERRKQREEQPWTVEDQKRGEDAIRRAAEQWRKFDDRPKKMEDRTEDELRALNMTPEEIEARKAFRSDDDRI